MGDSRHVVRVGIADLQLVKAPETIRTSGLGSCVGVVIYDSLKQLAGMAHVMLPDSSFAKKEGMNELKYADTAIAALVEKLYQSGAGKHVLKAKIAGGAQMFPNNSSNGLMQIGSRNVEAVQEQLSHYHIPVVALDVGGNCGRTIEFDPRTSNLNIRTVHHGDSII
ncbi:chemotaxis protein CheD [Lentibacillus cibarius]|uniref:Probable chemoreceptor glutamine deamidase CheD n=1 Tax=Lentibacillus cibarius TaxID=2583219 RepID=A0A5S3QPK0_9BACI|nr:chemotaxis protein CheD [Lentibacillus cibarius]TMN23598.1 chemotaxis protein CheD [Lentibacillus cibarius]